MTALSKYYKRPPEVMKELVRKDHNKISFKRI